MTRIKIKLIENGILPQKKTDGAACYDCYSRTDRAIHIPCFGIEKIPLGFAIQLDQNFYADIRGRSGNSLKGIDVKLGCVDSDYRGEVCAIVQNLTGEPLVIQHGERIAQMNIRYATESAFDIVDELDETARGENGFGSTGTN